MYVPFFLPMKRIKIKDCELAVLPIFANHLKDDNTIVLFLHEALGSIAQWKDFPQNLCNQFGLNGLVYERCGHGSSSQLTEKRGSDYLHNYALIELRQLILEVLAPEKKVILVGHSDGASIALIYASMFPKNIIGIISMAAHVVVEDETLAGIEPAVRAFENGKLDGLIKYHGEKTSELFYAWANTWNLPEFRDWNICDDLKRISAPILAIQGKNDQYGTEKQLDLIVQNAPNVQKEFISDCGHHPHLEIKSNILELVYSWYISNELQFED